MGKHCPQWTHLGNYYEVCLNSGNDKHVLQTHTLSPMVPLRPWAPGTPIGPLSPLLPCEETLEFIWESTAVATRCFSTKDCNLQACRRLPVAQLLHAGLCHPAEIRRGE